jgi:hypothetical protein
MLRNSVSYLFLHLVHIVEVQRIVCLFRSGVEVDLLELVVESAVGLSLSYYSDQTHNLHHVATHHDRQDHDVVVLQQLAVVLLLALAVQHQENQSGCEDAEQPQVENVTFALAKTAF